MVTPAQSEELFIVLTLPEEDITPLIKIQKTIAKNYNLFPGGNYPELHITLNKVHKKAAAEVEKIMAKIADKNSPVEIIITQFKCLGEKFLVLEIENTNSLNNLANKLHQKLAKKNLSTIQDYEDWEFHLTLVSDFFSSNTIPQIDMKKLCLNLTGISRPISTQAETIELWRPTLEEEEKTIASFKL